MPAALPRIADSRSYSSAASETANEVSRTEVSEEVYRLRRHALGVAGILFTAAFIVLAGVNSYLMPVPDTTENIALREEQAETIPLVAEAYSDMTREIRTIDRRTPVMSRISRAFGLSDNAKAEFFSSFTLNGIVYDGINSWALINNEVVRLGDGIGEATLVGVAPRRAVLLYKNELFDLIVQ